MKYNLKSFIMRSTDKEPDLFKVLEELKPSENIWIAGGCLRRTLLKESIKNSDTDVFFRNVETRDLFHKKLEELGYSKKYENEHNTTWEKGEMLVQTIHISYYDSPESLIDSFDFTICQLATDGKSLWVGDFTLWDVARKRLALHKLTYGVSTVRRLIKYTKQGFTACSGVMAGILEAVIVNPETVNKEFQYID